MQDYGTGLLSGDEAKSSTDISASYQSSTIHENDEFDKADDEQLQDNLNLILTRTKKLIVPFFGGVGVACLLLAILGVTQVWEDWTNIIIMLALTGAGSILGAYGIYKWGTIQMEIERMSGENSKYEGEIAMLKTSHNTLKDNVDGIYSTISDMKENTNELESAMHEFDDLRKELEQLGHDNEDINSIVNGLNDVYDGMHEVIVNSHKSQLYELYYAKELSGDREKGLTKGEFERLCGRLTSGDLRDRLEQIGTFEEHAGADGVLQFQEFQALVSRCLDSYAEEMVRKESDSAMRKLSS